MATRSLNKPLVADIFREDQLLRVLRSRIVGDYSLKLKAIMMGGYCGN